MRRIVSGATRCTNRSLRSGGISERMSAMSSSSRSNVGSGAKARRSTRPKARGRTTSSHTYKSGWEEGAGGEVEGPAYGSEEMRWAQNWIVGSNGR